MQPSSGMLRSVYNNINFSKLSFDFDLFVLLSCIFNECSAKELSLIRQSKAHPRPLPPVPPKDFVPTGSQEEAAAIEGIIQSKLQFLKDERAERKYLNIPYLDFYMTDILSNIF
jgi:hypothetical protein